LTDCGARASESINHDPQRRARINTPGLTLIVAMDRNRVIGADGGMPWHIPGDLRWFKQQTLNKPILMGRRTFESIGRPLPRRRNLVLSRHPDKLGSADVEAVSSLDEAIQRVADASELMIIGGAQIYQLALPRASRLIVTRIDSNYAGDTFFPEVDWPAWLLVDEIRQTGDDQMPAHRFMTWQRKAG
jgi:dihydrofolate reductase